MGNKPKFLGKGEVFAPSSLPTMSSFDRGRYAPVYYDLGDGMIFIPMETTKEEASDRLTELHRRT